MADPQYHPDERPPEPRGPPLLSRRDFIGTVVKVAVAGALIPAGVAQLLPATAPLAFLVAGRGPLLLRDRRTNIATPVRLQDIGGEPPVVLTVEWNLLPAVIYKVSKSALEGSSRTHGYNTAQLALQHPTEPDNAIMVYEGRCKHLGCTVGWNPGIGVDYSENGRADGRILCPCHQGQYDIYDLALNIPGTPPPAPLDAIEFDVVAYTDDLGVRHADTLMGITKYVQGAARAARGESEFAATLSPETFDIRNVGWSE